MTRGSLACLPRYGTPRTDRPTRGTEVGEVARRLGLPLLPWQQHVVDVALELGDDGRYVYEEVDITVPRQSGKTTLIMAKTVHRLVVMARTHGPQRSMYTAQTRLAARKKLELDFAAKLRAARSFREVPHPRARPTKATEWRLSLNNGMEHIQFGARGSYWQIDAPTRTGTHGDTLDDATLDEAFAHEDDGVEGAVRPAQATRVDAQIWVPSTAGDVRSKYLWRKVKAGREAAATGEHGRVAYFEWSAPEDADPSDPSVWRMCSPALGLTIAERFLEGEWERACRKGQEGIDTFRRAFLNQWPEVPVLDEEEAERLLPEWGACEDHKSGPLEPFAFALDVAPERRSASIAVAATSKRGGTHGEITTGPGGIPDHRPGTDWLVDRAWALHQRWGGPVAIGAGSPAASLKDELLKAGFVEGKTLLVASTADHANACGELFDAVAEHTFHHLGQPELNAAAAGAAKRYHGDSWLWSRRHSSVDISPLVAVTLAKWALDTYEYDEPAVLVSF